VTGCFLHAEYKHSYNYNNNGNNLQEAIAKYEVVTQNLEFARDLQKQFQVIESDVSVLLLLIVSCRTCSMLFLPTLHCLSACFVLLIQTNIVIMILLLSVILFVFISSDYFAVELLLCDPRRLVVHFVRPSGTVCQLHYV